MIRAIGFVSIAALVAGCAGAPVDPTYINLAPEPAVEAPPDPKPVEIATPLKQRKRVNKRVEPGEVVDAVTVFPYEENRIYQVSTRPGFITAMQLEPGEVMPGKAAIGNPDPADWIVEKTTAGGPTGARVIVLVKPGRAGIGTNLVLATNRRVYQLDITSVQKRGMDIVRWSYPVTAAPAATVVVANAAGFDPEAFSSGYTIDVVSGERPKWTPVAVFWTGSKTYIEFPSGIGQVTAPALFGPTTGGVVAAIPFRVKGRFYEIDQQITSAELRQGDTVVRIRSATNG